MNRKIYYWKLRDSEMQLGERTLIMGVLNITPDSFSDGGRFNDPDRAYARALELEEHGADIIDIGAESTKPGSQRISADEEWQRLVPVLKRLRGNLRAPLSLDTYKSEIAERALQYGVEIFNDPSGLTFDPNLAKVAANGNAGLILNHMRGQPETWSKLPPMQDALGTIIRELDATASRARHAGVERARIVIDPGLGFGKRKEQNAEILAHLKQLNAMDYPILVGPSRKSFLAQASETETLFATAAAVAAAVLNGAHIVRVHDVKEMQAVIHVAEEIARAAQPKPVPEEQLNVRARTRTGPNPEPERVRPTRPPLAKAPVVAAPVEQPVVPVAAVAAAPESQPEGPVEETLVVAPIEVSGEETGAASVEAAAVEADVVESDVVEADAVELPSEPVQPPVERPRKVFTRPDSDKRDGSRPPVSRPPASRPPASRPFTRRPDDRGGSAPPPRGRDFRPGQGAAASGSRPGFKPSGPRRDSGPPRRDDRPDYRDDSRPSRPPYSRPGSDRGESGPPRREFRPSGPGSGPPRSGPPRSGPPYGGPSRSGPPRSGPPYGGPPRSGPPRPRSDDDRRPSGFKPSGPKRSFDDRGGGDSRPPRSGPPYGGPPRSGPPRSGPPRGDRPGGGPSGPPKRPFRKRP